MRRLGVVLLLLLACAIPVPAQALGPSWTLGYPCQLYFIPPTTRADNVTPITGALTYSLYVVQSPTQPVTMPLVPAIASIAGVTAAGDPNAGVDTWKTVLCAGTNPLGTPIIATAGQWWVTLVANEAGAGSSVQTSPPLPFALAPVASGNPNPPTNVNAR